MITHRFGGTWTERKLHALHDYLVEYQRIFTKNPSARKLKTIYVDAFAGTGERDTTEGTQQRSLFGYDDDARSYQDGSVAIALSLESRFHEYVFIDNKTKHAGAIRQLIDREF